MINRKVAQVGRAANLVRARLFNRRLAIWFLLLQGLGTVIWWALLLSFAPARAPFVAGGHEAALLAFLLPDLPFYIGGSFLLAYALATSRPWAFAVLCIYSGGILYATLYTLALALLTGGSWLGVLLLAPSLFILPLIIWRFRPEALR